MRLFGQQLILIFFFVKPLAAWLRSCTEYTFGMVFRLRCSVGCGTIPLEFEYNLERGSRLPWFGQGLL